MGEVAGEEAEFSGQAGDGLGTELGDHSLFGEEGGAKYFQFSITAEIQFFFPEILRNRE